MILYTMLEYFSRFVSRTALENFFLASTGQDYDDLRGAIEGLPDDRRFHELTDLIFGIDETAVKTKISQVSGCYLFIDYSAIKSSVSALDVQTDLIHVAVTVAMPHPSDEDQFANMLGMDECLDIIAGIRDFMRNDIDTDLHLQWLQFPTTISPFVAKELSNSFGWTMEFDITGTDII